jgi:hypothetical protein
MNIFFLHFDPKICAMWHLDKHIVKMPLEVCQMLCAVWLICDPEHKMYKPPYKLSHKNHPCTIWARESIDNYNWLVELGIELCKEYTYRYGKIHSCEKHIEEMKTYLPPIPDIGFTTPAQAMPDEYKDEDPVVAYKHYYFFDKHNLHSWNGKINGREKPIWILEFEQMFA